MRHFLPFLHLAKVKIAFKQIEVFACKPSTYKNKIYRNLFYRKSFEILHQFIFVEWKDGGCSYAFYLQQTKQVNSSFKKFNECFKCLIFKILKESFQRTFRAETDNG